MQEHRRETWVKWRGLVAEQGGSGQSVAAFCRERGVPASQLFAWRKRLNQAGPGQFVAVRVVGTPAQPATADNRAIEIRLGGRCVFVEPGFDADHLRAVVAALEARA